MATPPATGTPTSGIAIRVGLVAILLLAGVALGAVLTGLNGRQEQSRDKVDQALMVVSTVQLIDGLEWRAVSGEMSADLTERFDVASDHLRELLGDLASDPQDELVATGDSYLEAVDDMFVALEAGDTSLARSIDDTRVDPGYEALLDSAQTVVAEQRDLAEATSRAGARLMWLSLGMVTVGFAVLLLVTLGSYEARRTAVLEAAATQRLRSFVEGSPDVITIVAHADDLTVLSPSLGVFQALVASSGRPERVSDLLAADDLARWRAADELVRTAGGHHQIDVAFGLEDGTAVHVEGHGSQLISDPIQRVWVWRDVSARRELESQLNYQAFHDSLTGLANRALFHHALDRALSASDIEDRGVSVLYCDLDNFKAINDSLGHGNGDLFLKIVTQRIRDSVRNSDTVARLGGDEFAVLLDNVDTETALAMAARIIETVGAELTLADRTLLPSISVGVSGARDGTTAEQILREADLALYDVKRSGKGRAALYHHEAGHGRLGSLELQAELRSAVGTDQISLHYQPTVNLADGTIEGVEALARWNHPTRGPIQPDVFIPIAESTGLIIPLGRWILQEACRAAVELQHRAGSDIVMAVNVSPVQLHDPNIVDHVKDALRLSGLAPERLVLEVTEGTLLDDRRAIERLQTLRALGLKVAIDDFGTGYTSIGYLQGLPVDILKIDRSFVSGNALPVHERQAFLATMVGLAKTLGLRSIAEGIEASDQLDDMARAGCDVGQGYLWSPATPLAEALTVVQALGQGGRQDTAHPMAG